MVHVRDAPWQGELRGKRERGVSRTNYYFIRYVFRVIAVTEHSRESIWALNSGPPFRYTGDMPVRRATVLTDTVRALTVTTVQYGGVDIFGPRVKADRLS